MNQLKERIGIIFQLEEIIKEAYLHQDQVHQQSGCSPIAIHPGVYVDQFVVGQGCQSDQ